MSLIDGIRKKIKTDEFEFSKHAVDLSIIRRITIQEVGEAILQDGELIEDYPDDKFGPSCLILGFTEETGPYIFNAATRRVRS